MFFSRISRVATKRTFQATRKFSGDPAEAAIEASKWVKYSMGKDLYMLGDCYIFTCFNLICNWLNCI